MNFLKKKKEEKKKPEPIYKANGKIVLVSFDGLNPADFPYSDLTEENIKEKIAILRYDGILFVNRSMEYGEFLSEIFAQLIPQTRYNLDQFAKMYRKKYPNATFENWYEVQTDEKERTCILAALLAPTEARRRELEKKYYSRK